MTEPAADPAVPGRLAGRLSHAVQEAEGAVADLIPASLADEDRSWIARRTVGVFIGAIIAYLVLLLMQGGTTGNWSDPAARAEEIIKTVVVPIVTLVLGYYFGQSRKG